MIIHIWGASVNGKTNLVENLTRQFGNKVIVQDIDAIQAKYIKEHSGDRKWNNAAYKKFIVQYVQTQKRKNKPLIFVGINNDAWWFPSVFSQLHSDHKFYVDVDNANVVKQTCLQFLKNVNELLTTDEPSRNFLVNNNPRFMRNVIAEIKDKCNLKLMKEFSKIEKDKLERDGYTVATSDEIYDRVVDIINGSVGKKQKTHKARKPKRRLQTKKTS